MPNTCQRFKNYAIIVWAMLFVACGQDYKLSVSHEAIPCTDGHCHKKNGDKLRPDRCLACHPEISRAQKEGRGLHAQPEIIKQPSCAQRGECHYEHRTGVLLPAGWQDQLRSAGVHGRVSGFDLIGAHSKQACRQCHKAQGSGRVSFLNASSACVSCHAKDSPHGEVRVANLDCQRCHTAAGWKQQLQFDHQKETQYPLEGKHQGVRCTGCHKDRKFRMSTVQYADCLPCHQSKHGGTFGMEACRTCHTPTRNFMDAIPFDHERTRFSLTGGHNLARMKDKCQTCHKPGASGVPALDCSTCHKNSHRTRFIREPQCTACHTGGTWNESAFNHGNRTRFQLTANHVAATLNACRICHRGKGPSDFEDLRGLVNGSGPAKSSPVNCLGCHQHSKAHNGKFTSRQCLDCHERPGTVQPKVCRGPNGYQDGECINKMTWVGHGADKPFRLTGGHDLARMKNKCLECHSNRNAGQGFSKIPSDCFSCHEKTDQQRGHRTALEQKCEDCHDSRTGTWKNTARFKHELRFSLEGAHTRPTACRKCHKGANLLTAFKPRSAEPRLCGNKECHREKVKDSQHGDKFEDYCGTRSGCHNPTHERFLDPRKLIGTTP